MARWPYQKPYRILKRIGRLADALPTAYSGRRSDNTTQALPKLYKQTNPRELEQCIHQ